MIAEQERVAVIGCGSLGSALVRALLETTSFRLTIVESDRGRREAAQALLAAFELSHHTSITCAEIGSEVVGADLIVLAVKPQDMEAACVALKPYVREGAAVLSLLAGVRIQTLKAQLGEHVPVVRAMPNLAAQVGASATAVFFGEGIAGVPACATHARALVTRVIEAMGIVVELQDESLLDAVTAVAGSGPAYFFALTEHLIQAATDLGLSPEDAQKLVLQTASGSAEILRRGVRSPAEWRAAVTSPQGTTAAAFEILDGNGWGRILRDGVARACERSRELAKQR